MGDDERVSERLSIAIDARVRRTQSGRAARPLARRHRAGMRAGDFILLVLSGAFAVAMLLGLMLAPVAGAVVALIAAVVVAHAAGSSGSAASAARRSSASCPTSPAMLSNGAAAGLSLAGAIELAAREMPEPAGGEMRTIVEQMRVGQPVDARSRPCASGCRRARLRC